MPASSLLGVGAATLATGGVFAGLAFARSQELQDQQTFEERNPTANQGRRLALGADILFGVGGAVAVAGIAVIIVSVKRDKAGRNGSDAVARRPRISPWATRQGAGLNATLRF